MSFQSLDEKIKHARSLTNPLPQLPWRDISELFNDRRKNSAPWLTWIDTEDRKYKLNYQEFCDLVLQCAAFLQAQGLKKGDRIATISHNHWHTVIHYFAAWMLGLVVVPVNLGEDDKRIAYILENGEVKLAFIRKEYEERILGIINSHPAISKIQTVSYDTDTDEFTASADNLKLPDEDFSEAECLIVFTSGTTGNPKGVVLSQRNLLEDARSISGWHKITGKTRMMCVLPIHHVNGTVVTLVTPFFAGGSVVLNQKFRVGSFFPVVEQESVHIVSVVPTLLQYLNSYYADKSWPECQTLSHVICGAGPLTVNVAENFEENLGVKIVHGYGLSETTCYSCFVPIDLSEVEHKKWRSDYGYPSIGIPIPANEMAIQDPDGKPVPEGERGEIVIRGVNVMLGYFNNREANENAFTYGWFRSGDEGFYINDEKGRPYFFITGRLKELIIRGGINLAPLEIDEVINRAPGVKAGIAVGFENDWYGEEVGAYVQLKEGAKPDEKAIIEFCQKHLPYSKCPKVVIFGDDIPVTSTGKYQRIKVAHLFKKWKDVQFRA